MNSSCFKQVLPGDSVVEVRLVIVRARCYQDSYLRPVMFSLPLTSPSTAALTVYLGCVHLVAGCLPAYLQ